MARKNITGISFGSIGLNLAEEKLLKAWLKKKGCSWARLRKRLVLQHLESEGLTKPKKPNEKEKV